MGQEDILKVLRKSRRPLSSREILEEVCQEVEVSIRSINNALKDLREADIIDYDYDGRTHNSFKYKIKKK